MCLKNIKLCAVDLRKNISYLTLILSLAVTLVLQMFESELYCLSLLSGKTTRRPTETLKATHWN